MKRIFGSIAILGRPNVGKSSLFNRFVREQNAITTATAGTTRDVKKSEILLCEDGIYKNENDTKTQKEPLDSIARSFLLFDTGGLDDNSHEEAQKELFQKVAQKAQQAASEADLVLFLVDGKESFLESERRLFWKAQKDCKRVFLVINKIDNESDKVRAEANFAAFGAKEIFYISCSHNRGIKKLAQAIYKELDNPALAALLSSTPKEDSIDLLDDIESNLDENSPQNGNFSDNFEPIRIGIIGRTNVGKSSLLNALLGEERSIVSDVAGTTMDPVNEIGEICGRACEFVDTAGIRRRGKIGRGGGAGEMEKYALARSREVLGRSNIALLVLDSSADFVELDEKIAGLIDEFSLGVIVVWNKWDAAYAEFSEIQEKFKTRFKFLSYAPILTISAKTKRHIEKLQSTILSVFDNFCARIPTSQLNSLIKEATTSHQLPSDHGKIVKIYYATQFASSPPQIALIMNRPNSLHFSYKRYLVNYLREHIDGGFLGVKPQIIARGKNSGFKNSNETNLNENS